MQRARVSNHPCHRLSVPAAKRFWCRHCMMVFEDAITRWRHSRSCRSGGFDNFVRRREIETQALRKMAETLDPDMMTQVSVSSGEGGTGNTKELCCFICRQRFLSLDEMREHVKYPCNKPVTLPRPSMTVYIEEPTFGTGIQQHYTDGPVSQGEQCSTNSAVSSSASNPHPVTVYMNDSEQGQPDSEAKPTNIYVNEKGETVIEVENLDLNTKSGELSLAHLLTQLSQQGIVFDQQPQGETEITASHQGPQVIQEAAQEVDYRQPTAVDAANTLTQLAGSMYRATSNPQDSYTYAPPLKRIKAENEDVQFQEEQPEDLPVQTFIQKEELPEGTDDEKYIICTSESEVISVVRADNVSPDNSNSEAVYGNGAADSESKEEAKQVQTSEEAVMFEDHQASETLLVPGTESGSEEGNFAGTQMMMLPAEQVQVQVASTRQLVKSEDHTSQLTIAQQGAIQVDQIEQAQTTLVSPIHGPESSVSVVDTDHSIVCQEQSQPDCNSSSEIGGKLAPASEGGGSGLAEIVEDPVSINISRIAQDDSAEHSLVDPQIVSVTSEAPQVTVQHMRDPNIQGSAVGYNLIQAPDSEREASTKTY